MARWSYDLQSAVVPSGTLVFKLFVWADSDPGLTVPNFISLAMLGGAGERQDMRNMGLVEVTSMDFRFTEDYSVHSEGFWFLVLHNPIEISVSLDEGGGAKHFFYGRATPLSITLNEVDLSPGYLQRHGEFTCVSMMTTMEDHPISDLLTEVEAHLVLEEDPWGTYNPDGCYYITLRSLMACLLRATFIDAGGAKQTYDEDDIIAINPVDSDIQFEVFDGVDMKWGTWADTYLYVRDFYATDDTSLFMDPGPGGSWVLKYGDCWSLFRALCKSLSLVPSHWYDYTAARHKLTFYSGPRSAGALVQEPSVPITSIYNLQFRTPNPTVMVTSPLWGFPYKENVYTLGTTLVEGEPETGAEFELTIKNEFRTGDFFDAIGAANYRRGIMLYTRDEDHTPYIDIVRHTRYYDYSAGDYVEIGATVGQYNSLAYAQAALALWKFNKNRKAFERTYATLKGKIGIQESQQYIHLMRSVPIDDGSGAANFYITEYDKDPIKDEMKLKLIEV